MFTEEAGTSGFLQWLDQYNSKFHRYYNKGRDVYKEAYVARYNEPCTFGLIEFLKVLAGDAELDVPGMWFSWADPYDVVTAWRKVGIAGNVLKPELIDRSEFIDQPAVAATPMATTAPEAATTAPDNGGGDPSSDTEAIESERAKVQRLREYAEELEAERDAPFDHVAAGVLVPTAVTRRDTQRTGPGRKRLNELHGSVTMRGVGNEAKKRNTEAAAIAQAAQDKK
eukprot:6159323-Prymnesium_polylepis.1